MIRDKCGSRRRRKMRKGISSRMRQIVMKERLNISIFGEQYEGNFFMLTLKFNIVSQRDSFVGDDLMIFFKKI